MKKGSLPLSDPLWGVMSNPWWQFLIDDPTLKEERRVVWQSIPQISPTPVLCKTNPLESLSERRMSKTRTISTTIMENRHCTKLIQVFKPMMVFNLHSIAQELEMGVLEHFLTLNPGRGQEMKMLERIKWNLRKEAEMRPSFDECPTPYHQLVMNIIIWNSRGVLRPNFQTHIRELVQNHEPVILVVMETRLGRDKAKKITDRLLFDGAIHTDTIGYEGGLWLLWNSDKVEVELLAKTEQEIHVEVKVLSSNLAWLFSAIYASPKSEERCILWENLTKVAELHNKAWVMAGDFNELLVEEDKFGGRGVSISGSLLFKDCLDKCNLVDTGLLGTQVHLDK